MTGKHPIRPTSPRFRRSRQLEPGRRSTYPLKILFRQTEPPQTAGYIDVGNETSINFVLHEPDDGVGAYALLIWPDGRHIKYTLEGEQDLRKMGLDLADLAAEAATMAILRKDDRAHSFKNQQFMQDPEAIALNLIARILTCGEADPKTFVLTIAEHLRRMSESI